jgi:hypothetical protein
METLVLGGLYVLRVGCAIGAGVDLSRGRDWSAGFQICVSLTAFGAISLINGWV